jgi:hypothetical protein
MKNCRAPLLLISNMLWRSVGLCGVGFALDVMALVVTSNELR